MTGHFPRGAASFPQQGRARVPETTLVCDVHVVQGFHFSEVVGLGPKSQPCRPVGAAGPALCSSSRQVPFMKLPDSLSLSFPFSRRGDSPRVP